MARLKVGTRRVEGGVVGVVLRGQREIGRTRVLANGALALDAAHALLAELAGRP